MQPKPKRYQPANWVAGILVSHEKCDWINEKELLTEGELAAKMELTEDPCEWVFMHDMIMAITVVDDFIDKQRVRA